MLLIALALLGAQISTNYADRDESDNHYVRDFGNALLTGLPQDSILLCYGDLPGNAARFVHPLLFLVLGGRRRFVFR